VVMRMGDGPLFHRTVVVSLVPRYILVNQLDQPLEYTQAG